MNRSYKTLILQQDFGLILALGCFFAGAFISGFMGESQYTQNLLLLTAQFMIALIAAFHAQTAAYIATAFTAILFSVYKIYNYTESGTDIKVTDFIWPFLLVGTLIGMTLFIAKSGQVEEEINKLQKDVKQLTVIDKVTGMDNLRSLYNTLPRFMSMGQRSKIDFGLMLIRLRYSTELQKILSEDEFDTLRRTIAQIIQNTLRMEDRIFSISEDGEFALIYFADTAGASVIKKRLLAAFDAKSAFQAIRDGAIRVDIQIVYQEYNEKLEHNALEYYRETENEFSYEV